MQDMPGEAERRAEQEVQKIMSDLLGAAGDLRRAVVEFWELPHEARESARGVIRQFAEDLHQKEYSAFMPVLLKSLLELSERTLASTIKPAELPRDISADPLVRDDELRRISSSALKSLRNGGYECKEALYDFRELPADLRTRIIERWEEQNEKELESNNENIAREILSYLRNPPKFQTE